MSNLLRVKQDFGYLVNEILDKLPQDKLIHGTVGDPEMGGGQFMIEVERRKREAGLTDKQIAETCYGFVDCEATVYYLYNKYKLLGTYIAHPILERGVDVKFDIIVSNPPYQDPNKPRHKLWTKFIEFGVSNSNTCAFVAPKMASQLLSGLEVDHITLKDYYIDYYNGHDINKHFVGVGSDFCAFVISKNKKDTMEVVTDKGTEQWPQNSYIPYRANKTLASIISKTMNFRNDYKRSAARVEESKGLHKAISKIIKSGPEWTNSKSIHNDYNKPKMLYPTLGDGEYLDYEGEVMPTTSFVCYIPVSNKEQLKDLIELQNSELFKFLVRSFSSMRSPRDFVWKNISKHMEQLSNDELDYIKIDKNEYKA